MQFNESYERLRVVVTGLAATFPFGGMFWHYFQYVTGLQALGHDVLYVEDTGRWTYNPVERSFVEDGAFNGAYLARNIERMNPELSGAWFFRDARGRTYGRNWADVQAFCRSADLLLNISLSGAVKDVYEAIPRKVLVDTDPLYTQAKLSCSGDAVLDDAEREFIEMLHGHDRFYSYGLNIGAPDCAVPTGPFDWQPARQPIMLEYFRARRAPLAERRKVFTTVASWEPHEALTQAAGTLYAGKSSQFQKVSGLPGRCPVPLELALSGEPPLDGLARLGWRVVDAYPVSASPWSYMDYLAHSMGELSVAKQAYVASRSGWFSERSAAYLALGVPVIVQDTGFSAHLPTGEGILTFTTEDEAAAAVESVLANPSRHIQAAEDIAEGYFEGRQTLTRMIECAATTG